MIMQFPVAHSDELLISILARFVARQGLKDDKIALEMLFGSRNIVPSALMQGHIHSLLSRVGHIWLNSPNEVIQYHSIIPFFDSFVEPSRIEEVRNRLIYSNKSHAMSSIGINASTIKWPRYFRYCPECLIEDQKNLAYSYWRRLFQLPGVLICPYHHCYLLNSPFKFTQSRRHGLRDATDLIYQEKLSLIHVAIEDKLLKLSNEVHQLLKTKTPYVTPLQWTIFYQRRIIDLGAVINQRPDHVKIRSLVLHFWGNRFLEQHGLSLELENNWLLAFFRKHRRHYSPLHHIVCIMALFPSDSILDVIHNAVLIDDSFKKKRVYTNIKAIERCSEYRTQWLSICSQYSVLKDIRATREGTRVYSWLYRFDNTWLQAHLPIPMRNDVGRRIDWAKRDFELIRKLIRLRNLSYDNLNLSRMTQSWFIININVSWGVARHLAKLPLCKSFFIKYTESIDEYQIRRVLAIIIDHINLNKPIPKIYEIERIAGLSKERSREAVKLILRLDFEKISCFKLPSKKY